MEFIFIEIMSVGRVYWSMYIWNWMRIKICTWTWFPEEFFVFVFSIELDVHLVKTTTAITISFLSMVTSSLGFFHNLNQSAIVRQKKHTWHKKLKLMISSMWSNIVECFQPNLHDVKLLMNKTEWKKKELTEKRENEFVIAPYVDIHEVN